jgi:hypothetical protein
VTRISDGPKLLSKVCARLAFAMGCMEIQAGGCVFVVGVAWSAQVTSYGGCHDVDVDVVVGVPQGRSSGIRLGRSGRGRWRGRCGGRRWPIRRRTGGGRRARSVLSSAIRAASALGRRVGRRGVPGRGRAGQGGVRVVSGVGGEAVPGGDLVGVGVLVVLARSVEVGQQAAGA